MTQSKSMNPNYSERLALAMKQGGCSTSALAAALGVSYQAVKKVLDGKSNALTAENNAKAAIFLRISSHWLATGEGEMDATHTTPNIKFSMGDDKAPIVQALESLDRRLKELAPVFQDSGREVLRKWAMGIATTAEVADALEAMALASETMEKKKT